MLLQQRFIFVIEFLWSLSGALQVLYNISTPNIGYIDIFHTDVLKHVTDLGQYGLQVENISNISFEVKSCKDTSIYLVNSREFDLSSPIYNIHIGGNWNKYSAIRVRKQNVDPVTPKIADGNYLNCSKLMPFWASWFNGFIKFGTGLVINSNIVAEWQDMKPFDINRIAISTGNGASGEWLIPIEVSENFEGYFSNCQRFNGRVTSTYIVPTIVTLKDECTVLCSTDRGCIGFNYLTTEQRCELLTMSPSTILAEMSKVVDLNWEVNFKCYNRTSVCIGCFF